MNRCFKCKDEAGGFVENVPHCNRHFEDAIVRAYGKEDAARRGYGNKAKNEVVGMDEYAEYKIHCEFCNCQYHPRIRNGHPMHVCPDCKATKAQAILMR